MESTPPPQSDFGDNASPQGDAAADRMFNELITHPEDDMQQDQVAEQLEDREKEVKAEEKKMEI